MTGPNQADAYQAAVTQELQMQRSFLGDRAVNLAAELASVRFELQKAQARIAELEAQQEQKEFDLTSGK